ncbi:MAG: GGDEF domain-containing protein [Gammaproteobacteria bacterium]|nr:GGDEF domain-containing protein [Gammaproteobacteria bacterium]
MIIVMRDSYLYAESGHLDELGLVGFSYALVWAVLLIAALSHRRANSGLQNALYYDVDSEVLDPRALLRVLEKSVANTLRYEQKMSVVMFEFYACQGSITSAMSTGSKFESGLLAGISANLRRGDTLAKWKDNSFVIIVPENDAHGCEKLLNKLTQIMQNIRLPGLDSAMIHYGIAVLKHQSHTELLDVAEQALEEKKRQNT